VWAHVEYLRPLLLYRMELGRTSLKHLSLNSTGWSNSLCAPDDYSPHTTDDLKTAITEYIRNVDRAILNTVFKNAVRRVSKCLETGGGHIEHYL
jgi:hypothetical protein